MMICLRCHQGLYKKLINQIRHALLLVPLLSALTDRNVKRSKYIITHALQRGPLILEFFKRLRKLNDLVGFM